MFMLSKQLLILKLFKQNKSFISLTIKKDKKETEETDELCNNE